MEIRLVYFLMISNVLGATFGAQHSFIFVLFATVKAVSVNSPQVNKKNVESLLGCQVRVVFLIHLFPLFFFGFFWLFYLWRLFDVIFYHWLNIIFN